MAPRRLLILMLVLLGISSVIAILLPNPRRDQREREAREAAVTATVKEEPAEPAEPDAEPATKLRQVTLAPGSDRRILKLPAGSRLVLTVEAEDPSQVLIPKLGRDGFADRWAPAVFDLMLPTGPGRFPVRQASPAGKQTGTRAVIVTSLPD